MVDAFVPKKKLCVYQFLCYTSNRLFFEIVNLQGPVTNLSSQSIPWFIHQQDSEDSLKKSFYNNHIISRMLTEIAGAY